MNQTQFALRRNELIAQYLRSIEPAWKEYQARLARGDQVYEAFRAELKPHLELLFARIAGLRKQLNEVRGHD